MRKIVIGNWKMNPKKQKEARVIFDEIVKNNKGAKNIDIVICPPFPFLSIGDKLKVKNIKLGSQNVFEEMSGPYTGEVSPEMLLSLGVKYVILGHSERRALGETDKIINKKVLIALKSKLLPIICVGENTRDVNGFYLAFIKHQLIECLSSVPKNQIKNIIIAYEPVWAIGPLRPTWPHRLVRDRLVVNQGLIAQIGWRLQRSDPRQQVGAANQHIFGCQQYIPAKARIVV